MFVVDLLSILPGKKQVIRDIFQNYWDFQDRWNQRMPAYARDMVTVAIKTAPQEVRQFSQMGSGSLPGQDLPTRLVAVQSENLPEGEIARRLRRHDPPVFARVGRGAAADLRTLLDGEEAVLVAAFCSALREG